MKKSGIYRILNKHNNKCYIGSSADIVHRFYRHQKELEGGNHSNNYLQRAWAKYGKNGLEFSILFYCDKKYLIPLEQSMIDFYNSANRRKGYNICSVAGNCAGVKHTKKTALKIKRTRIERGLDKKQGELMKGNDRWKNRDYSKPITEETRKKQSLAKIGTCAGMKNKHHSKETKAKMSLAKIGKPSPATGKPSKLRGRPSPLRGRVSPLKGRSFPDNGRQYGPKKGTPSPLRGKVGATKGMTYKKRNKKIIQETRTLGLAV